MSKKKSKRLILGIGALVILIVLGIVSVFVFHRTEKVPKNPAGTVGNTAGNLNNGGYFCESNGYVYFANAFDDGTLYRMTVDEGNIEKISGAKASNILVAGDYIYYFQLGVSGATGLGGVRTPHSFNRCHTNGKKAVSIVRSVVTKGQLVGDTLFLQGAGDDGSYLFAIGTNREDEHTIAEYVINPAAVAYDNIYFVNTTGDNYYLKCMNTKTEAVSDVLAVNMWDPIFIGDYIYYIDMESDCTLRRYSVSNQTIEILTKKKVQFFNATANGYIYFQTSGKEAGLYCMNTDGGNLFQIAEGQYCDICTTSKYVYFKDYFDQDKLYHSILGTQQYSLFEAAMP